jgi:hypothetical protein
VLSLTAVVSVLRGRWGGVSRCPPTPAVERVTSSQFRCIRLQLSDAFTASCAVAPPIFAGRRFLYWTSACGFGSMAVDDRRRPSG